jgi:hypothetical protein
MDMDKLGAYPYLSLVIIDDGRCSVWKKDNLDGHNRGQQ